MWIKWFPWRHIVSRLASAHGFVDPITIMSYMRRFAQPSEVAEPIELLRAGAIFHARGLMNSRAIQQNLDWIWPYWVERQFNPDDAAFIPRAFSLTQVNLTARNWTAAGVPDCSSLPIVDPRGLLSPFWDGWSLDVWIANEDGVTLAPSMLKDEQVSQRILFDDNLIVETHAENNGYTLETTVSVEMEGELPVCRLKAQGQGQDECYLVISLRPYNPEGISFVHHLKLDDLRTQWYINKKHVVRFTEPVERHLVSNYANGDVSLHLTKGAESSGLACRVGMITAAAMFKIAKGQKREVQVDIPLKTNHLTKANGHRITTQWSDELKESCKLSVPDEKIQYLYDSAIRTLILHSPGDVFPGPFTYKRFWFRDAAFIVHAMLCANMLDRAQRALKRFPSRQTPLGYFHSQEGEWDSNGQALWVMSRYCELRGCAPPDGWIKAIKRGAHWITKKRLSPADDTPHSGLLPAGFSAEHFGPNDYYYWDDFWSVAGLKSAAKMLSMAGDESAAGQHEQIARELAEAIEKSLQTCRARLSRPAIPASPYRRLDSGAIGSITADYPLQLYEPGNERIKDTANFLMDSCRVDGGFFQDMIHSGINAYLTLQLAQVLMRSGDQRFMELIRVVADLASPTGQWPEAIHPRTRGGCMGDGQHVWASAEWVMMIRNCLVFEEAFNNRLLIGAGVLPEWLEEGGRITIGPTPTQWGPVSVEITAGKKKIDVRWEGKWRAWGPKIEVRLPGYEVRTVEKDVNGVEIERVRQK